MNRLEIADELYRMADKIVGDAIEPPLPDVVPTDEQISMNIFGVPDMLEKAGEKWFAKVRHLYDPKRDVWHKKPAELLFAMMYDKDGDPRRFKPEMLDGVMVRRQPGKLVGAFAGYWIAKGYMRVEEDIWYKRVDAEDGITSNEQELWLATYPNRNLDTSRWYKSYRDMYEQG